MTTSDSCPKFTCETCSLMFAGLAEVTWIGRKFCSLGCAVRTMRAYPMFPRDVAFSPKERPDAGHPHLIDGEFQSDKYPTCPRGKVPLSVKDKTAQDLLWVYAQRRRAVDAEFAHDLEIALRAAGFEPREQRTSEAQSKPRDAIECIVRAYKEEEQRTSEVLINAGSETRSLLIAFQEHLLNALTIGRHDDAPTKLRRTSLLARVEKVLRAQEATSEATPAVEQAVIPVGGVSEKLHELLVSVADRRTSPNKACAKIAHFIVDLTEARDQQTQKASPPWLPELLALLGWQGGTIHQALAEVGRLKEAWKR